MQARWLLALELVCGVVVIAYFATRVLTPHASTFAKSLVPEADRYLSGPSPPASHPASWGRLVCAVRALGSSTSANRATLYGWSFCENFVLKGGTAVPDEGNLSGSVVPVVVSFVIRDGSYRAVRAVEPRDAPMYAGDVHHMFPGRIASYILADGGDVAGSLDGQLRREARLLLGGN